MRIFTSCLLCFFYLLACANYTQARNPSFHSSSPIFFTENKGQVTDQNGYSRTDIQYVLQAQGINIFVGNGQLHYQFSRKTMQNECRFRDCGLPWQAEAEKGAPANIAMYRVDVALAGANLHAKVISEEPQGYYENYYMQGCPATGIQAHTCNRVTYKNVYPDIDWVIYVKDDRLENEFVVGPAGNASMIKIKYSGQTALKINKDGSITATTPMGTVKEDAPVCYTSAGYPVHSGFRLQNNVLSYAIDNYKGSLVIDPSVEWGTYYGADTSTSPFYGVTCDASAFVYACGLTYSATLGTIATTGSFLDTMVMSPDAYLVKFDSSGNRIWGTYYGGNNGNWGTGVACDQRGNVYLGGTTAGGTGIVTTGCQQPAYGGGEWDGFLVKFNSAGVRQWATYIGGTGADIPSSVCCDIYGHVYISGFTGSPDNIATPGGFKTTGGGEDIFLEQYDTTGVRKWGTYYGGENSQFGGVSCTDAYNVYLAGWTLSSTGISSPGSYQPALNGTTDAFAVKFDTAGTRIWATYYGGESSEQTGGITCDDAGNLFLLGTTYSDTGMTTPGCFQSARSGGSDAFLAKLNNLTGFRIWGTYYGGPSDETTDLSRIFLYIDNVYITGITTSTTGIASAGAWQTIYGGGDDDAFLADFDESGNEQWSTYLGGSGLDEARACTSDGYGIYVCGQTSSPNNIATSNGFLSAGGGGGTGYDYQGFLVKFIYPDLTLSTTGMQQTASNLRIYPSPNNGSFTLTGDYANTDGNVQIIIIDMAGNIVLKDNAVISNGIVNKRISLSSNVPPGMYLLKTISKEQANVLKVVKE